MADATRTTVQTEGRDLDVLVDAPESVTVLLFHGGTQAGPRGIRI
jgi:hypothetical protein